MKRRDFLMTTGITALAAGMLPLRSAASESSAIAPQMTWQRRDEPALSATTTELDWCRTYLYSPHVVRTNDGYVMYYIGRTGDSSKLTSLMDFVIGRATSPDGFHWKQHADPVLTSRDVPWGAFALQTPYVLWDDDEMLFKLYFIGITEWVRGTGGGTTEITQRLGYATSGDGIAWDVHPEPIFESGRRPCVHRFAKNDYRMWMNSRPARSDPFISLYQNVYEFRSHDGIAWSRSDEPVLRESEKHRQGAIYPFVSRDTGRYFLWYGAYPKDDHNTFQIYLAESDDGTHWTNHDDEPAFAIADDHERFDSFYVSTPCVLVEPDRYLMYYSAVSWEQREKGSYYQHIGVAVCPRDA